jgi:tyrosyl-tRNA synthetase
VKSEALKHLEVFKQNAVDVLPADELLVKIENSLSKNKPLRLKIGFDPTARDIHLGHVVLLRKIRKLQDLGHHVCFIIGDFTAKIGDPSGRSILRPILSDAEIADNAKTYTDQAFKILDQSKTEIIYNSVWYKNMSVADFLSLLSSYTVARMLERDDFSLRMKENRPLTILEMVYPLVQGYDSVMCEADVEFGGTDQKFNLVVGRHLQEVYGKPNQAIITMPLLVGLDGKNKMSKSLGNYIGLTESPKNVFGKVMSISDEVMWEYYRLLSDTDREAMRQKHPKEVKMQLACEMVALYNSKEIALAERSEFERVFSQREVPQDMVEYKATSVDLDLAQVLVDSKLMASKNEARRLVSQGGVSLIDINDSAKTETAKDSKVKIPEAGIIIKVGKKNFLKVTLK